MDKYIYIYLVNQDFIKYVYNQKYIYIYVHVLHSLPLTLPRPFMRPDPVDSELLITPMWSKHDCLPPLAL